MSNFLLVHTSLEKAFVSIAKDGHIISTKYSDVPKEHGSFLHKAIADILSEQGWLHEELSAIGVTAGPGSYTGIRVGLSAAKGLGYAWKKPLIVSSNLMALAATASDKLQKEKAIYIPLIHARQNEYYLGFYNEHADAIQPDALRVLNSDTFSSVPATKKILFGAGLENFKDATGLQPDIHVDEINPESFAGLVSKMFFYKKMTDAENAVPVYLKDVYIRKG